MSAETKTLWFLERRLRVPLIFVAVLVFIAIAASALAPYPPTKVLDPIALKSTSPSLAHPFGTDTESRDVLSRVIYGARVSLFVATASVAVGMFIGVLYGALSAIAGGKIDSAMMRVLDVALSIPRVLVLLAVSTLWDWRGAG